jgi:hypothetical protein
MLTLSQLRSTDYRTRPGAVDVAIRSADCSKAILSIVTVTVAPSSTVTTIRPTATLTSPTTTSTTSTRILTTTVDVLSTETTISVSTIFTTSTVQPVVPRAEKRALTTSVPAYASSCTKPGAYVSACSCLLGSSLSTSTSTVTVTASVSTAYRTCLPNWLMNVAASRLLGCQQRVQLQSSLILC